MIHIIWYGFTCVYIFCDITGISDVRLEDFTYKGRISCDVEILVLAPKMP
jgi:hypothetical protein